MASKLWIVHKIKLSACKAIASITGLLSPDQITEYESLPTKRLEGIKVAGLKCRKLSIGNILLSAKYKGLTAKIELWRAVTKKRHCKFRQSELRRLEASTGVQNLLHCMFQEAIDNEKVAY